MASRSKSQHTLELASELLDDIELSRVPADNLLLKASRLARLVGSDEIRYWLKLEMSGYNDTNPISLKYMGLTGRWEDRKQGRGYWGPLAQHEAAIVAEKAKLACMRIPDSNSQSGPIAIRSVTASMTQSANYIARLSAIKSRVLARIHQFVTEAYYEQQFENLSETVFERYRDEVDGLIGTACGEILHKIPAVMDRLSENDAESVNQALATCRRILEAFADAIYPPTDGVIVLGGNEVKLDARKHQNRINAYVHDRTASQSRRQRIRQNLSNLYDRVSTGIHADVSAEEARALFLNTYLLIGEVLHLQRSDAT